VGEEDLGDLAELVAEVQRRAGCKPILCIGPKGQGQGLPAPLAKSVASYCTVAELTRASVREMVDSALADRGAVEEGAAERLCFSSNLDHPSALEFVMNGKAVRIRGFTLLEQIGEGGMSRVFFAERDSDVQKLVLKVMDGSLMQAPMQLQRFMHEYRIVAQINSRWVVKIYDQGFTDDHVFIAMEHFPGGDLKRLLGKPFVPKRALSLLWDIGMALHSIHRLGIVHRDLKPQNIMFRADRTLALLDFGVSQMESMSAALTQSGELVGTPLYMSPEQAKGQIVDARSDLYSLGTIFYEMLTGRRLFTAKSLMMIIHMHATEPPPPLPVPLKPMQELLDRLLAKDPAERFQSAQEMLKYVRTRWGEKSLPASRSGAGSEPEDEKRQRSTSTNRRR
jgi:serine/threonine protein kinase